MEFIGIAQLALTGIILGILVISSKEDLKYNTISKRNVMLILIFTLLYTLVYKTYGIERTVAFVIAFGMFGGVSLLSRGKFGFGDSVIIASLALYIGRVHELGYFFIILAYTGLAWGSWYMIRGRLKDKASGRKTLRAHLSLIDAVPIQNVVPGMILASDYFMTGLTESEIEKLKKRGLKELRIKYAYPFIPVILIAFIIYLVVVQYHVL
jgi:Flp pilus assembly protein protease CpaA